MTRLETPHRGLTYYLHIVIMAVGLILFFELFPDTSKVI